MQALALVAVCSAIQEKSMVMYANLQKRSFLFAAKLAVLFNVLLFANRRFCEKALGVSGEVM